MSDARRQKHALPMPPTTLPPKQRNRPPFRAARAFYLTLFIGACLATYAILTAPAHHASLEQQAYSLHKRSFGDDDGGDPNLSADEQCRLVHHARDQCAFVKSQCPDEESGFAAYLDLYYCRLPNAKAVAFIILISWLGLLFSTIGIAASDFFCINLSTIATILGMSESMAGVTFLAFGNGSPDVFSTFAAMSTNSGSLAVGELFGAAGFITAVVSGSMALIRPFHVARKSFIRDVGFFVVAAAFSIVFLWDGKLRFWECICMVVYYIFYVAFVVAWHWWLGRRRMKREKEAAVRGHFVSPGDELEIEDQEYRDDPDEDQSRPATSRGVSAEDWSALERGGEAQDRQANEDEDEEARDRWMSELNSNMRLTRPPARSRKNTLVPVRPSLVGALEFQAVMKSLQKSRNIQTYPMNTRRYSDDPTYTTAQQQDHLSTVSDPAARPPYQVAIPDDGSTPVMERQTNLEIPHPPPGRRMRAVSANNTRDLHLDPDLQQQGRRSTSRSPERPGEDLTDLPERDAQAQSQLQHRSSDTLEVPQSGREFGQQSPRLEGRSNSSTTLRQASIQERHFGQPDESPREVPTAESLPRIMIPRRELSTTSTTPGTSPFPRFQDESLSPFPRYHDDPSPPGSQPHSIHLPPPASPESLPTSQGADFSSRPSWLSRWWPYSIFPPPGLVISTLFPTIYHWHDKNYWEKALGVVAAPSVFLLTITLPVVESGKEEEGAEKVKDTSLDSARSKSIGGGLGGDSPGGTAAVATSQEQNYHRNYGSGSNEDANTPHAINNQAITSTPITEEPGEHRQEPPQLWNRWLLILQLFLAPLFIVLSIYSQSGSDITPGWLIRPTLICLLISLILLIPLLLTTTPTRKPRSYRHILSLAGFAVSISWISTIAAQVVGALKALAVILNMSHAIMGLTIFAVGNSLGDLVADVTVARLGYPVMALSACFGGPMLNILLGIGLSGSWILLRGAEKRVHKHPDKHFKFKSYHIEVENTLMVSGATLLVTLLGLLVFVPMNKWVMSKRIGWTLIALWTLSTVGNVVLEVTGWVDKGRKSS